jgi:hypothetical protein
MPLHVVVYLMGGANHHYVLEHAAHACACHLKFALGQSMGYKRSRLHLSTLSGQPLHDGTSLFGLMNLVLGDILDPKVVRRVHLELELSLTIDTRVCTACAKPSSYKCACCRRVRYCSKACQRQDWSTHQLCCRKGVEAFSVAL